MGRDPKPAKSKGAKPPITRKSHKDDRAQVSDLENRLAEALRDKAEALKLQAEAQEQQAATAEILRVISSWPTDLQPVLDALAVNATRVSSASDAVMRLLVRDARQIAAHYWPIPVGPSLHVTRGSLAGRAIMDREAVHFEDMAEAPEDEFPEGRTSARRLGIGTALATPLLRESVPIGAIVIRRNEVRPFSDKQAALLQTFADQAVIAIENVRLFNETKEALDRQTATSEILRVISSSPTDVQPVFDAIAKSGTTLCDAAWGAVIGFDGQQLTLMAQHNMTPSELELVRGTYPRTPTRGRATGRAIIERRTVHVPDIREAPDYLSPFQQALGFRTVLAVPMLRDGEPIGVLALWRREVRRFTDPQIALMETFASQAVIAIENVRLFNETKEALDRQTATAEIL